MKSHIRILILEIDSQIIDEVKGAVDCSQIDAEIIEYKTEKEFFECLNEAVPDVIISGYSNFDGFDIYHRVKNVLPRTTFILADKNADDVEILDCLNEGVDDFILVGHMQRLPVVILNSQYKREQDLLFKNNHSELLKSYANLRTRFARQHALNEEQRFNLAREIHDELGQVMTALKIDISMLGRQIFNGHPLDKVETKTEFDDIIRSLNRLNGKVKSILSELRPEILDELGVIEAIRWLVDKYKKNNNIKFELSLPDVLDGDQTFPITLYRIVQATLTNITRHTDATLVSITLKVQKEMLLLIISCDGKEIAKNEFKLMNVEIRERVGILDGKFEIGSRKPRGKKLRATIPFGKQLRIHSYDKGYNSR